MTSSLPEPNLCPVSLPQATSEPIYMYLDRDKICRDPYACCYWGKTVSCVNIAYGGCPQFLFPKTAILCQKTITLEKLLPSPQRVFASWKMCGNIWGKKQGLENGVCCPVTDLWRKLKLQFAKVFFVAKVLAKDCVYLHVLYVCSVR